MTDDDIKRQSAPSAEPVAWQWLQTGHFRKSRPPTTAEPGAWRPLYTAPQPTLPPEAAQAMRAVSDWLASERIRDWRYMEGTAFWEDAAKHVAALRAALDGEAG
jgi:predicted  nucleic acid-binding Zn ribbon protein